MEKTIINVPKGIRYISEWKEFSLPEYPCIINKSITGCGFTEWCIRNNQNVILCSPRKILLENKEEQHPGELLYVRNELDKILSFDKDLISDKLDKLSESDQIIKDTEKIKEFIDALHFEVNNYYLQCLLKNKPCKLIVTYDSYRHLVDALGDNIKNFYIIIDEFQSIFTDSRFKSSTEIEFLNYLKNLDRLCFVSATPMMDKYLDMLDEFKDLPYIELDWGTLDPGRIIKPQLLIKSCRSIVDVAVSIIDSYKSGNFEKQIFTNNQGVFQEIESRELVIYVNSVKNICDIIKKCHLTLDNTNILCAKTPENEKKIKKAFGLKKSDLGGIGSVPLEGELHKMFTLCTRTVYLGTDFYSTCARSIILSDANVDCLAVDITLDLPQILGRQRLNENPWKNRAELYFKTLGKGRMISAADFINKINDKQKKTNDLLISYQSSPTTSSKCTLAEVYRDRAKSRNYRDDYVAVNTHGGKDLFPVFNNLVMVSELRAYEIQQVDYRDRFTVFNVIQDSESNYNINNDISIDFLKRFDTLPYFTDKMRLLCELECNDQEIDLVLDSIPIVYKNYYMALGKERILSLGCQKSKLDAEYERLKANQSNKGNLLIEIYSTFAVGEKYLKSDIKNKLGKIYDRCNITLTPKATDLENYFELKLVDVIDSVSGKRTKGFKLIDKKELI